MRELRDVALWIRTAIPEILGTGWFGLLESPKKASTTYKSSAGNPLSSFAVGWCGQLGLQCVNMHANRLKANRSYLVSKRVLDGILVGIRLGLCGGVYGLR